MASVAVAAVAVAGEAWETEYERALEQAQQRGGYVLVDFTGSDWCRWCKVLKEKVLDSAEFEDCVRRQGLTLLELDYPRSVEKLSAERLAKIEEIRRRYGVESFPTVMLLDAQGRPFARLKGSAVDAQEYVGRIEERLKAKREYDAAVAAAGGVQGVERALALSAALEMLPEDCRLGQSEVVAEIVRCDVENKTDYKRQVEEERLLHVQRQRLEAFMDKYRGQVQRERVEAARDEMLAMLKEEGWLPLMRLMMNKYVSDCYAMTQNLPKTLEYLEAAIASAPGTKEAAQLKPWAENLRKHQNDFSEPGGIPKEDH